MLYYAENGHGNVNLSRRGFSLIELMIVVAVLGALVAVIIPSFSYSESDAKRDVVVAEMRQLREAFVRFYRDNYPSDAQLEEMTEYGLWPLFTTNVPPGKTASIVRAGYDAANQFGWRGPYAVMEKSDQQVHFANGQLNPAANPDWPASVQAETTISTGLHNIPVALDPYSTRAFHSYYRVMGRSANRADLYLVCTGPDQRLDDVTLSALNDFYDCLQAGGDDIVLPLIKP